MEYVREKNMLSNPLLDNIQSVVYKFAEINKRFYDAVMDNEILKDLY